MDDVRAAVRAFLDDAWDPDLAVGGWWARLAASGWAAPTWPVDWYGRGLGPGAAAVVVRELAAAGAPGPPAGLGLWLAGPTILAHGTDEQRRRHLLAILDGREAWCQLFSEPGAGSDLAGLRTRAVRDGEGWVVTGQKVWSSGAHEADFGMLLARTDADVPKHRGITYFLVAMDQPGVEVRPLRQMTGHAHFNEVFLEEVRVRDADVVGAVGEGWRVAATTLAHERSAGAGRGAAAGAAGRRAGFLGLRAGDLGARPAQQDSVTGPGAAAMSGRLLLRLARERGRAADPMLRQQLARVYTETEIARYTALRLRAATTVGREATAAASTMKLALSRLTHRACAAGLAVLGAHGMLAAGDAPLGGAIQEMTLAGPAISIAGGTDEIQRTIVGERALGLPREPDASRDVPFRDLLVDGSGWPR